MTDEDRRYADCTCTRCGAVHRCTPSNDFYTLPQDSTALLCEDCFAAHIAMPMLREQRAAKPDPFLWWDGSDPASPGGG